MPSTRRGQRLPALRAGFLEGLFEGPADHVDEDVEAAMLSVDPGEDGRLAFDIAGVEDRGREPGRSVVEDRFELRHRGLVAVHHDQVDAGLSELEGAGSPEPPGAAKDDRDLPFESAYLSFLAARTSRIRLGTQIFNIGLRHPFVTARAVATMDILSTGRLNFGIGVGWLKAEWDVVGLDFESRGSRVDESIEICRRLWTEEEIEHHGRWFDFAAVKFEPKPAQVGGIPLHIGGDSAAALRRAGTVGEAWMPMNHAIDDLASAAERIARWREEAGRRGRTEITYMAEVAGDGDGDVDRLARAGVDRAIVKPWRRTSDAIESLEALAAAFFGCCRCCSRRVCSKSRRTARLLATSPPVLVCEDPSAGVE
jgi:probable F420-dependent oxidoreductase